MTPGQEALAEAARRETALVYGTTQHEHRAVDNNTQPPVDRCGQQRDNPAPPADTRTPRNTPGNKPESST